MYFLSCACNDIHKKENNKILTLILLVELMILEKPYITRIPNA